MPLLLAATTPLRCPPPAQARPWRGWVCTPVLTCPAGRLFHALVPAAAVWAWVSLLRLLCGPTARLAFAAAARRSGRSQPRPSGSDNPGCPPPWRCAGFAPAPAPRDRAEAPPPAGEPLASRPAHTRAHAPPRTPASRRQADPRTAGGTHRPNPQPRRWQKPSHPTPSPLPQAPASANARQASPRCFSPALPNFLLFSFPKTLSPRPTPLSQPCGF